MVLRDTLFPPRAVHQVEISMMVGFLETVIAGRSAVYVSTAINTGRRFVEWHAGRERPFDSDSFADLEEHRRLVVQPNLVEAEGLVKRLRQRRCGTVVIDPTRLPGLPGWIQADYHVLWAKVIERYVCMVVFADGWEHSNGCCYEFLVAQQCRIRTVNARQRPITCEEGRELISEGVERNRLRAVPTEFLEAVLRRLGEIDTAERYPG